MEIWIGGGILYLVLLITLGVITVRPGHWVMFIIGLFLPFFWLIGAILPPVRSEYLRRFARMIWVAAPDSPLVAGEPGLDLLLVV